MKKGLLENGHFVIGVFMCFIGLMSAPSWVWARSVDYKTDWVGAFVPMSVTGVFGVVVVLGILFNHIFHPLIWETEKRLIRSGWKCHCCLGIMAGLAIIGATVLTGVATILTAELSVGLMILLAIAGIIVCSFGTTLLSIHNAMAKLHGQKIFFL